MFLIRNSVIGVLFVIGCLGLGASQAGETLIRVDCNLDLNA